MSKLYFYTTSACHLCEQAAQILEKLPASKNFEVDYRDIADDAHLIELYGVRIPVLKREDNPRELDWPFDELALGQFLAD